MHAAIPLTEIALIVLCALVCGLIFTRLRQPAILGYVLAGVVLGPHLLDAEAAGMQPIIKGLAELGVFMLLFLLGVDMNLRFFRETWLVTIGCVLFQVILSLSTVYFISVFFNWSFGLVFVLGCIVTLSSTAVAIKMLESIGELKTDKGHLTIGILIAQDLAFVPMILIIQGMGEGAINYGMIGAKVLGAVGVLVLLIWALSRAKRVHIPYLSQISRQGEMTSLLALAFCFGLAALTGALGLSEAYGAFLAGLVLGNTAERHEVIKATHPIQSLLLMVFFLSIGLLIDLSYIWENIYKVGAILLIVAFGKTALNAIILHLFKQPWSVAFISSLVLAQIGEFAFVLGDKATEVGLLNAQEYKLVISVTVMSLVFSPFWMSIAKGCQIAEEGTLQPFSFRRWALSWTQPRN
jgi:CPA2 family monovalent cation:H+ antiporter-2